MSINTITTVDFIEDLSTYIAANSPLSFVEGTDLVIGALIELEDGQTFPATPVRLALFEDPGGELVKGRIPKQRRPIRFIIKENYAQGAVNLARQVHDWLIDRRRLTTDNFIAWMAQVTRSPSLFVVRDDGTHLADFSIEYIVLGRP